MQNVELHEAFFWVCETCGVDNFETAIEVTPDQNVLLNSSPEHVNLYISGVEGTWLMDPTTVECKRCGTTYKTITH